MSHKSTLLGAAASIVFLAGGAPAANAANFHGWYVALEGGANWVQDDDISFFRGPTGGVTTFTQGVNQELDTGWAGIATIGYAPWDHLRVELEGGYRHNGLGKVHFTAGVPTQSSPGGDLHEWTIMANVAYDFMLSERLGFSVGVGAGVDDANYHLVPAIIVGTFREDDDDWNFAAQVMAGFSYAIGYQSEVVLNYRYLHVEGPTWNGRATGPDFLRFESDDLGKHAVTIGLRFYLHGEEPVEAGPPPPDLPPPPPAQSFMIFFGFNKCNITPEADNVLAQAAAAARQMGTVTVQIVGHTDTKGTGAYNQKLSECRAHAAKSNMVAKGVPDGSIHTSGKGETELLVQTADGVKEPQNRRATIDMQ